MLRNALAERIKVCYNNAYWSILIARKVLEMDELLFAKRKGRGGIPGELKHAWKSITYGYKQCMEMYKLFLDEECGLLHQAKGFIAGNPEAILDAKDTATLKKMIHKVSVRASEFQSHSKQSADVFGFKHECTEEFKFNQYLF